jgi:alcohol dehydrogenase (NADP+)
LQIGLHIDPLPGKRVGIIGVGGLGRFCLLWAKALGCDKVVAVSRSRNKEGLAAELGADYLIAADEDGWSSRNASTLDLIVSIASSANMPLSGYLNLLRVGGQFIQIGEPEGELPGINVFALIGRDIKIGGSIIGSPAKITEMLAFAVSKGVRPRIEQRVMKDANQVIKEMAAGKA